MKTKITYVLLILLTFVSACSSDDDNNNNESDSTLVGTWIGVSSTFNGQNSGVPDNSIVKFTADNRTEFVYEGFGNNGEDITEYGDWSKNGSTLTITWEDADPGFENYILNITELTESSLKWETEISGEGTLTEAFVKQ